ncbi:acyl-CoA dehydrogenase family protein [Halomonas elongata]|uniref:Cyclohexane-1-carbonyl-CoA dehydrogenase n=1 Tax=Halomonas elongata (strain ATCC 33173 / DSM 2581 / NBRC 15536 / NCIMB 2198 / 1H9) TaxID=768066 RepID=E1VC37_HALED|nr:acyl-CoA dehydrogenase family protein [Halomonas elongata]MDL4863990.1 acyl-CoA dehydrogenase family protein [Halomonas elongata]WBF19591.1 acyl-CoA dehydrogenase family protein [Halomonas elongata]WPU48456.1 acyl-CoA dehydrogenase family protein [Halomonas elongata DSM 2581]WVI73022.1 acyl-CoA dehydrogenase family protein [Halomonas elongata]CBV42307.1 isobutyryl-CoA dehydrogenase [Halomonas elongata DSM 2581]
MDFALTEDQKALADAAADFARAELAEHAAQWDADSHFPVEVIRRAGEAGFLGIYTPEEHGGLGLSRLEASLIFEQLAQGCVSTTAYLTIHNMVTWMVASWGDQALRERYVPAMIAGEALGSYCLTEPGAGSDAASLRTRAVRDGDDYVINGSKMFISGAGATEVLVVMARTGEPDSGAGGVSALLVPADAEGIEYGKNEQKMGWKSQPTRLVSFDDVRVPVGNRLGNEGEGFKFAMKGLDGGRLNIASCSLGAAQHALTLSRDYLAERKQFGRELSSFQALQFKIADMASELTAARLMVRHAAWRLDQQDPEATAHCAMAKRFATDVGFNVCNEALQLHGGYGYIREYPLERLVRDTRVHQILEGTNEIMRLIAARRLLADGVIESLQ